MSLPIETLPQTTKKNFWRNLFNIKILIITLIIWISLICQDFYAFTFRFDWIPDDVIKNSTYYFLKFTITLFALYFTLILINFLIKLPVFKSLYHKKLANIILIIWSVMNITGYQFLFFYYVSTASVFILKFLHLISMYALTLLITKLIKRFHEPKIKHQLILTTIFCAIGWIFLLLTYPGCWAHDDIGILADLTHYYLAPWHHFFSGIFYVLCLQTLPFVFSVIFFQVILNSLMFSYCVVALANIFAKTTRQKLVLEIILSLLFIFPPIFFHTLAGYRMGIYQFLELYLLTKLITLYFQKDHKITCLNILEIIFFTILVGTWRTECFFYPFIVLAALLFFDKERIKRSIAFLMSIISLVSILVINTINTKLIGSNDYTIISTILPICAIIHQVDLDPTSVEILDKVIDVNCFKTTYDKNPIEIAHETGIRKGYSKSDFNRYLAEVVKLSLKYPTIACENNINLFKQHITGAFPWTVTNSIKNFVKDENLGFYWNQFRITRTKLHKPINHTFRKNVIYFFNGLNHNSQMTTISYIFYNLLIPLILIVLILVITFFTRNWFMLFPIIALYIHLYLVIFTATTSLIMYYLSIYLCAYVFGICVIWNATSRLIEKIKNKKLQAKPIN